MPSQLAQTAKVTRVAFFGSIILLVVYLVASQILGLAFGYLNSLRPKKESPASVGFGKLPKPNFRSYKLNGSFPTLELDTTTGELPKMPFKIEVYPVVQPKSSYLYLDRAKDLSRRLGFPGVSQNLSSNIYYWEEGKRSLKMNVYTQNFVLDTDLSKLTLAIGELPQIADIKSLTLQLLSEKGLAGNGYEEGDSKVQLAAVDNGNIVKTQSPIDSSLAIINLYRSLKSADDKADQEFPPLMPPDAATGNIRMLAYFPNKRVEAVRLAYNNWEIDKTKAETYPLKNIAAAWQEVVGGTAIISSIVNKASESLELPNDLTFDKIFIRNIYLAYFDDEDLQKYLQPIYVFEGSGKDTQGNSYDFTFYTQAVDSAWVEP